MPNMNPNKNKSRRIEPLRRLRKTLTFGFLRMGMELSRRGSKHTVEEIRQVLFTMARLGIYGVNEEVEFIPQLSQYLYLDYSSVTDNHWSVRGEKK